MNTADMLRAFFTFPLALFKPKVTEGYFPAKKGRYQKIFFNQLLKLEYRRTKWQYVLPCQTAGLVKTLSKEEEHHVRFYDDGMIDLEVEVERHRLGHVTKVHAYKNELLPKLLKRMKLPVEKKREIRKLFKKDNLPRETHYKHKKK